MAQRLICYRAEPNPERGWRAAEGHERRDSDREWRPAFGPAVPAVNEGD